MNHKFPKTYHAPWSPGVHSDDKKFKNMNHLANKEVVVSIKKDGENTRMARDGWNARSLDSAHNFTRDWVARLHSIIRYDLPENHSFYLENVSYYHSIFYKNLPSYVYLLMIVHGDMTLHYDEEIEWANLLEIPQPEVLYRGIYDEKAIKKATSSLDLSMEEGYVIRHVEPFHIDDFQKNMTKFVRKNHIQPNNEGNITHWLKNTYPNELKDSNLILPSCMRPQIKHSFDF